VTVIGLILVAIGVIALLMRMDVISGAMWGYIWPVILIIIGIWFFTRWRWLKRWGWCDWEPRDRRRNRLDRDE